MARKRAPVSVSESSKRSDYSLHVRVGAVDLERLLALSRAMEMTKSQVIRVLVKTAAEKVGAA